MINFLEIDIMPSQHQRMKQPKSGLLQVLFARCQNSFSPRHWVAWERRSSLSVKIYSKTVQEGDKLYLHKEKIVLFAVHLFILYKKEEKGAGQSK